MKKVVVLGDWLTQTPVGMHRFAFQILKRLDKMLGDSLLVVELLVPQNVEFENVFQNIKVVRKGKVTSKVNKKVWEQILFPAYVICNRAIGVDLTTVAPVFGCKIYAIHDCIPVLFPQNFSDHRFYMWSTRFKLWLITKKNNRKVITVSNHSAADIQKIYKVQPKDICVIYNGWEHMQDIKVDDSVFQRLSAIDRNNYYFSVGSKYLHKNYRWIVETARKNPDSQFVISGSDAFSENWLKEGNVNNIPPNVYMTGYLSDEELKALMLECKALIFPSLYEGFGIPPLEALSLGKRIIVSNTSCLPEIYQDSAYYIDPYSDGVELKPLLEQNVGDAKKILDKFTWENAARSFFQLLESYSK